MDKFNQVYNQIITEWNENNVISEGFLRKIGGAFRTSKGKNEMMKKSIMAWMNGNKISPTDKENKFMGTLPNGYTIKFTFRESQWNNPESTAIDYAVYLSDPDGNKAAIDNKGTIDYSFSDVDIKKALAKKLEVAMSKSDVKNSLTSKSEVDKKQAKEAKAAAKAKAKEEKAAAKQAAAEKAEAEKAAAAQKDAEELAE
jgi:hypothetical protein